MNTSDCPLSPITYNLTLFFPLPHSFLLSQGFSEQHRALDFACPTGTPVYLDLEGQVTRADYHKNKDGSEGYGNHVRVQHPDGALSLFAHLSSIQVQAGQHCQAGELLGYSGSTGNSTGPHLHYEYRPDGKQGIDPSPYFAAVSAGSAAGSLEVPLEGVQPGDRIALRDTCVSVNLRPQPSAEAGVPDLGDLTPGISLPVFAVQGEWLLVGVWVNSRYVCLCQK